MSQSLPIRVADRDRRRERARRSGLSSTLDCNFFFSQMTANWKPITRLLCDRQLRPATVFADTVTENVADTNEYKTTIAYTIATDRRTHRPTELPKQNYYFVYCIATCGKMNKIHLGLC